MLVDCDLVDCAALGDERIQSAIAGRPRVTVAVSAALAEVAVAGPLAVLARNPGAEIADVSLARMVQRFGHLAEMREALLGRPDLPIEIAQAITAALAHSLETFVTGCGWLSAERGGRVNPGGPRARDGDAVGPAPRTATASRAWSRISDGRAS